MMLGMFLIILLFGRFRSGGWKGDIQLREKGEMGRTGGAWGEGREGEGRALRWKEGWME